METESHVERRIQEIGQEYQAKGYAVTVKPQHDQLPDFLSAYQPDMLACGDREKVIVEVKSRTALKKADSLKDLAQTIQAHPGWRLELVVVNPEESKVAFDNGYPLNEQEIARTIREGESLLVQNHLEAALLLGWASTEATLRLLAGKEDITLKHADPSYLLKQLVTYGVISKEEYRVLGDAMKLRNAVSHGFKPEKFAPDAAQELLGIANTLLQSIADQH